MSEMIERVARALAKSYFQRGYDRDPAFFEMKFRETGDPTWNDAEAYAADRCKWPEFQTDARAAIEAMREPSNAMLVAMRRAEDVGTKRGGWRAAIDAALSQSGDG